MSKTLFFQGGTLVIGDASEQEQMPAPFQWVKGRWRCEGYRYGSLLPWLHAQDIRDLVPRWKPLKYRLYDRREPHAYQLAALDAWETSSRRGSIVLPTGAGKTFVAIHAINRVGRSALVVAPTIDLLHQWYARLVNAFETDIGVFYGGEKQILPLTVTTYHSAGDLVADHGQEFKLIIFDEVHHLPAPSWGEAALMAPAPARLGLTATYPGEHEQTNGRWRVDELVGPIVYSRRIEDLVGEQLAYYRTQRVRVSLKTTERAAYDADHALYLGYVRAHHLQQTYGAAWLHELMRLSAIDRDARRALLARQRILRLLAGCEGKFQVLEELLREHAGEQILIFTENNAVAYQVATKHLIPVISHETKAAERKQILEGFQSKQYRAIVTSRVLNEGVDVPEAK
ncbi:MAG TPA: DEAD/DEAH box helicase, partial [Ktedonobacteraceae bacterium]|nr:DEAD/DEAH box helicase [Ktedonobacteraceae bacterium]